MRLTLESGALRDLAALCARAADATSDQSADRDVHLEADEPEGTLTAVAHGGLLGVRVHVAARVERSGAALVSAKRLRALALLMGAGPVALAAGENHGLTLTRGRRRLSLPGLPPDEYPARPRVPEGWFPLPVGALAMAVGETFYASAYDPEKRILRPHLAGVRLEAADERLTAFATDGHRAACRVTPYVGAPFAVTLPAPLAREVRRGLFGRVVPDAKAGDGADEAPDRRALADTAIDAAVGATSVWLRRAEDRSLTTASPLVVDQYPAWRGILALRDALPHAATVDRAALHGAALALSALGADARARVPCRFEVRDDELRLTGEAAAGVDGADAVEAADATHGAGERGCVVNAAYVRDACAAWACERVRVRFGGPADVVWFEPLALGVDGWACLMPTQL